MINPSGFRADYLAIELGVGHDGSLKHNSTIIVENAYARSFKETFPTYSLIVALPWLLNAEAETLYSDLVPPREQSCAITAMYS